MSCCELSVDSISHDPFALQTKKYPAAIITSSNTNSTDLMVDNHLYTFIRDQRHYRHSSSLVKPTYGNELINELVLWMIIGCPRDISNRIHVKVYLQT